MEKLIHRKEFKVFIITSILAFLTFSFVYLDFGIKRSEISINTDSEKFAGMKPEVDYLNDLYLYVEADESIKNVFKEELEDKLDSISNVKFYANLKDNYNGPVLAVKVWKNDIDYFPLYSTADIKTLVFFSSKGNTTYFKKFTQEKFGGNNVVVKFNSSNGPHMIKKIDLVARDTTYGIYSNENYKKYLMKNISLKISKEII